EILSGDASLLLIQGAVNDPLGGVYLYNATTVFHYRKVGGITHLLDARDLLGSTLEIQDISAGSDGSLWIATDAGIFRYIDGGVVLYLGRSQEIFGGIVRVVFADNQGRCWFAMPGFAGYYYDAAYQPVSLDILPPAITSVSTLAPTPPYTETAHRISAIPTEAVDSGGPVQAFVERLDWLLQEMNKFFGSISPGRH
ncbi:MAG: hypothetical protein LUQ40_06465, partial [Methanomicrobiales archaeon]|nr:hypothetical protein [Methanomicrobiales archaeon]